MKANIYSLQLGIIMLGLFGLNQVAAQSGPTQVLTGTTWNSKEPINNKTTKLKFTANKVDVIVDGRIVESMSYSATTSNTITFKKTSGESSCAVNSTGEYRYSVGSTNSLSFKFRNDDCVDRNNIFGPTGYTKVN